MATTAASQVQTQKAASTLQIKKGGECLERMGYAVVALFFVGVLTVFSTFSQLIQESDAFAKASLAFCIVAYFGWMYFSYKLAFIPEKDVHIQEGGRAHGHLLTPNTLGGKLRWVVWHTFMHPWVVFPICLAASVAYLKEAPGIWDVVAGVLVHFVLTCFSMSVILHRFFSHGAYKANRVVTFVLALLSCLAYQYGPLWWSSKHRRHHKTCDTVDDPHSWARYGLGYAWIGWTMHPSEQQIDVATVHRIFKKGNKATGDIFPELLLVDKFFFVPTWVMHALLFFVAGVPAHTIVYRYTMPSALCAIATLWFNCKFHPPPSAETYKHFCNSIDLMSDPLATFHGEAKHKDHHMFPNKAKRPGADLGWYLFIKPLLATGIIGEPHFYSEKILAQKTGHAHGHNVNATEAIANHEGEEKKHM